MSHETALQSNPREKLSPGQVLTSVVLERDVDEEGKAIAKHRKVTVFIKPAEYELEFGDTVCLKIADVREESALAVPVAKVN